MSVEDRVEPELEICDQRSAELSAETTWTYKETQTHVSDVGDGELETFNVNKMSPNCSDTLLPRVARIKIEKPVSLEHIYEDNDPGSRCGYLSYGIADAIFSACVVAPQVVSVWRGTWGLMELHPHLFPHLQIYLLGIILHVCFSVLKTQLLSRAITPGGQRAAAGRWVCERAVCRGYTYLFILANIMHWRGGWGLFDAAVAFTVPDARDPHRPVAIAAYAVVCYLTAVTLRSSRNLLASPYFLVTDGKEPTYIFTTRFTTTNSRETALYVLDCIFSVGVVGSLVVFVWRGSWALLDIFLYPDDQVKSCWISLLAVVYLLTETQPSNAEAYVQMSRAKLIRKEKDNIAGYALVAVTFGLQAPVRWAAARLHGAARLLLADAYHLLSFLATVNVWRGIWGLLDIYFFPETPKLSNWCSHAISLSLLVLLNCSNSVLVRGVYIDAEEPAGECVVFPCHYLRLYLHKERTKKRHKNVLAAAATASRKPEDASVPLQIPEEKV